MLCVLRRIWADVRRLWWAGPLLGAYWLAMRLLTGGGFCMLPRLCGLPCAGCGMTRALRCLIRWDFAGAWSYNPIVFLLPVYLLLVLFDGKPFRRRKSNRWLLWGTVILTAVLYILRLPGWV